MSENTPGTLGEHRVPVKLAEIRNDFLSIPPNERLQLLLEFANELPELPERFLGRPELLERVAECQSPVYIFLEVTGKHTVYLHATAPREAPTTRGFAAILVQGLANLSITEALAIPGDYPLTLGLTELVSPLRMRGMSAMIARVQRQLRKPSK